MLAQFRALGCVARIDRGGNVIAHLQENRTGPYVALTAHLDTVLAPRKDEEVYVTPDGRLHGPGTADNGAGLAALLAIARVITSFPDLADDFRNLVFVANVGEEGEGNLSGMRYLCRQSSHRRAYSILPDSGWPERRSRHFAGARQPALRRHHQRPRRA